ncbi:MAG: hypothetical protein M0C28_01915 [Candidatus Moduliflexus flocculans]|nr:hypothetical protein [Candidatus Moduliflexus flocculans]
MANQLCFVTCSNFDREILAVQSSPDLQDVRFRLHPVDCDQVEAPWPGLGEAVASCRKDGCHVDLVGGYCLTRPAKDLGLEGVCRLHQKSQCFEWLAGKEVLDRFLQDGALLVLPGWLRNWEARVDARWASDRKAAQAFFRELARKVVLLDTGDPSRDRPRSQVLRALSASPQRSLSRRARALPAQPGPDRPVLACGDGKSGGRRPSGRRAAADVRLRPDRTDHRRRDRRQDSGRRPGRRPGALPRPPLAPGGRFPCCRVPGRSAGNRGISGRPDRRAQCGLRLDRRPPDRLPQGRPRPGTSGDRRARRGSAARTGATTISTWRWGWPASPAWP